MRLQKIWGSFIRQNVHAVLSYVSLLVWFLNTKGMFFLCFLLWGLTIREEAYGCSCESPET